MCRSAAGPREAVGDLSRKVPSALAVFRRPFQQKRRQYPAKDLTVSGLISLRDGEILGGRKSRWGSQSTSVLESLPKINVVFPRVPKVLLQRVEATIGRYSLLDGTHVAVATSGGKDSTFACLVLRELGFEVTPVIVDMEFSPKWGETVLGSLKSLGFGSATLINAREVAKLQAPPSDESTLLRRNLLALDAITADETVTSITPCTSCYNSKVLAIEDYFKDSGFSQIVFAHHATDAVSSFLKSALMYVDRWDGNNAVYERERFLEMCRNFSDRVREDDVRALHRIEQLADDGLATTDEPPRQSLLHGGSQELIRPLLGVWEFEVESFISEAGLTTEPSGCGHSMSTLTQTPRELVQYEVVRTIEALPVSTKLLSLAMRNIDGEGKLVHNARRDREALLGSDYKKSFDGLTKL